MGVGPSIESGSQTWSGNCALLPHRADEQAQAHGGQQQPRSARKHVDRLIGHRRCLRKHRGIVERAEAGEDQADAEDEAEIADPVDQEGLEVGVDRALARVPEPDQQVGHETDRLPAEEQLQEVVAHHQHQHREGEQRDVREEPLVARIAGHVADRVDVHHERDEGHHDHHQRRKPVDQEADLQPRLAHREPGVDRAVERVPVEDVREHDAGGDEGDEHREDRHPVRAGAADRAPPEPRNQTACERHKRHREIEDLHRRHRFSPSAGRGPRR